MMDLIFPTDLAFHNQLKEPQAASSVRRTTRLSKKLSVGKKMVYFCSTCTHRAPFENGAEYNTMNGIRSITRCLLGPRKTSALQFLRATEEGSETVFLLVSRYGRR
jgi:hypothetical protein